MDAGTFLEKFAAVAEAPGGVGRLRTVVLTLAVQGSLTVSEPGSELSRSMLVSRGVRMREQVPQFAARWPVVRLADVAEVRLGRQRSPSKATGDRMRPYLRAANVGWGGLRLGEIKSMAFTEIESQVYELRPGDLLLGEASGSPSEVGKPAQYRGEISGCCFQNTLVRVRFTEGFSPDFYERFFRQQARTGRFANSSRGVGINHLGAKTLAEWSIPVPPLAEQRQIAAKVDELIGLCDELEARQQRRRIAGTHFRSSAFHALTGAGGETDRRAAWERVSGNWRTVTDGAESASEVRRAILQLAISGGLSARPDEEASTDGRLVEQCERERLHLARQGRVSVPKQRVPVADQRVPFSLPAGWEWVHLEDVCIHIVDCLHRTPKYVETGYPAIRTCDIEPGRLLLDEALRVDERTYLEQTSRLVPVAGDVFYSREGGRFGIAAVVPPEEPVCLSQRMMHFRCSNGVDPHYFMWFLNSPLGLSQARADVGGSASPHVNIRSIRKFVFPLPPESEQRQIAETVAALLSLSNELEARRGDQRRAQLALSTRLSHIG